MMKFLGVCFLLFGLACAVPVSPNFAISDLTGVDAEEFGTAVAMSGSLLVVGAPDKTVDFEHQGAALVYTCDKNHCSLLTQLLAFDAADFDNFGISVSVDGATVVVGASSKTVGVNEFQGAAYAYTCTAAGCALLAKLTSSTGQAFDNFGASVGVSGNYIVVGADQVSVNGNDGQGQAYLFACNTVSPGTCAWVSTLDCAACSSGDLFGYSVAISGTFVTVGAPFSDVNSVSLQGMALAFDCSNPAACTVLGTVTTLNGGEESFFGWSVTASGWRALIGSPFENATSEAQGAVYPVDCSTGSCVTISPLYSSDGSADDYFGSAVAISGSAAVFGASGKGSGTGSAYLFDCSIFAACRETRQYGGGGAKANDNLGFSVAISGTLSAIGLPGKTASMGGAFIYSAPLPTCAGLTEDNANWAKGFTGTRVYGTCVPGFMGSPSRMCELTGSFGAISNPCTAVTKCSIETYGRATWPETSPNVVATGTCDAGYSGSPTRRCQPDATWATNLGSFCTRNQCGSLNDGTATFPPTNSLTTVQGTCNTGFAGTVAKTCDSNGNWGPSNGACTVASCTGETYGKNVFSTTPYGQLATGTCVAGYFGTPQRQCTNSGWSPNVVGHCARITCGQTTAAGASFPQSNSGTVVYGSCISGTGNPRMTCSLAGAWINLSGSCI